MNRGLRLLAGVTLATTLTGCSVAEVFGPKPNQQILTLGQLAQADSEAWAEEEGAGLRAHHAEDLFAEVERLCGVDESGTSPSSCEFQRLDPEVTAQPDAAASLSNYVELIPRAPDDSRDLLTAQAVDLAAAADTIPEDSPAAPELGEEDAGLARDLLRREFAAVWALDMAQAHADAAGTEGLGTLIDAHESRIALLEDALEPTGEVPVAEPGYAYGEVTAPTDAQSALAFAADIETSLEHSWLQAAAQAESDSLEWFLALAGDAARAIDGSILAA